MASGDEWDAQRILDRYIHDYMVKKNMPDAADIFANEANVNQNPVGIDSPESFLTEWWSIFWDIYSAKKQNHEEANRESSSKAPMMTGNEQMAMQFPCGKNKGVINPMPMEGWPLTQQFHTSQVMAQTPGEPIVSLQGSTSSLSNLMLPRSDLSGQGDQTTVPMRQTAEQQQKDQQQLHENTRKWKGLSTSLAGESALGGSDAEVDKPLHEIFESYISHDDDDTADFMNNSFNALVQSSSARNKNEHKG